MGSIGETIRKCRAVKGLSQSDLAHMLSKTSGTIYNWESGSAFPDGRIVVELCSVLGITPNQLYGWDDNEELDARYDELMNLKDNLKKLELMKADVEEKLAEYKQQMKAFK